MYARTAFGVLFTTLALAASVAAQGFIFGSLNISETVTTQDPDIVLSVNAKAPGSRRSIAGWNNKTNVKLVVADFGRLELVPVPKGKSSLQILDGAYSFTNTGDPMKDWKPMENVDGNVGISIPLDNGYNGDQFVRMWVHCKNGQRTEVRFLFGAKVTKRNIRSDEVFSYHVLSVRDAEGNIRPWHLYPDGRVNIDSIVQTLLRYGSGITPGYELPEGRDTGGGNLRSERHEERRQDTREERREQRQDGGDLDEDYLKRYPELRGESGPCMVITSDVNREVMIEWYDEAGNVVSSETKSVHVGQKVVVRPGARCCSYKMFDRRSEKSDWTLVQCRGTNNPFPALTCPRPIRFGGR